MDSKIEPKSRDLCLEVTSCNQDALFQCYPSCEHKLFNMVHNFVCLEQSKTLQIPDSRYEDKKTQNEHIIAHYC